MALADSALRAVEFDRIVAMVADLAITAPGRARLAALRPQTDAAAIDEAQRATTEGTRLLADHPGFPLRASEDVDDILAALTVEGRALGAAHLLALATFLESIEQSRTLVARLQEPFPLLSRLVQGISSFKGEAAAVRRAIDGSGEVVDDASPALSAIRERLRRQRSRLRSTLDGFLRGRETARYLQDQVVTDRHGRYVIVVRAEHRSAIPGIVHGSSASGASLYLEPLETVEINNDIVALEEEEAEEVHRVLLALTDAFRTRPDDLARTVDVAIELDVIQARARLSLRLESSQPVLTGDGTFELRGARHPLLILGRESSSTQGVVPVDILLTPPVHVLVITGPNTGGKTVALKTAGLLAAMAQSGLHVPAEAGSRLPIFRSLFADIGDEQSITASLSTFSAHIANVVAMDRGLELPALVLLDEVGAGTDPVEGGALGIAVIDHFRRRSAHLIATTHYDALKSYASTTEGVSGAAFGFDPETFAPTYRIVYGSPGRSLAIEIAARLGMPSTVIAAARANLTEPEKQLADHLARLDRDLRTVEQERQALTRDRRAFAESERRLRSREEAVRDREDRVRQRLDARVDDRLREARQQIETVIDDLKVKAAALSEQAAVRLKTGERLRAAGLNTGDLGAIRTEARAALDEIAARLKGGPTAAPAAEPVDARPIDVGSRVAVGAFGVEGVVVEMHGRHAEVDVRGKRLRAAVADLRLIDTGGAPEAGRVRVNLDLQPRQASLTELNVIGCTVDEAVARLEKFLDDATVTDVRELRIVHGHGTGQLRRAVAAFLKDHPLIARFEPAPQNQGGGGATLVTLKE